jgi:sulfane dehydrogenase subunit SoxC
MDRVAPKPPLISKKGVGEYKLPGDLRDRVTPTRDLFVICHMAIPEVSPQTWRLEVTGLVDKPISLTLKELRSFPRRTVESFHKCAGSPKAPKVPTRQVANVKWTGVDLRELLHGVGVHHDVSHLWAYGLEYGSFIDVEQAHYLKDIPRSRIEEGDVLVAYEVNGEPLSPKHGAPARLIVPGYYGTNCVKWFCRLELQNRRADGMWTEVLYNDRDLDSDPSGHTTKPVWMAEPESMIVSPLADETVAGNQLEVLGWAWSNCAVQSVEVSTDGGGVWQKAELEPRRQYSWQKFRFEWAPTGSGQFELCSRATDADGKCQPMDGARNAIYSITVTIP